MRKLREKGHAYEIWYQLIWRQLCTSETLALWHFRSLQHSHNTTVYECHRNTEMCQPYNHVYNPTGNFEQPIGSQ
jgi:hypothetical protein